MIIYIPISDKEAKEVKDKVTIETKGGKLISAIEFDMPDMTKPQMEKEAIKYLNKKQYQRERTFLATIFVDGISHYAKLLKHAIESTNK